MDFSIASSKIRVHLWVKMVTILILAVAIGFLTARFGMPVLFAVLGIPLAGAFLVLLYKNPKLGVYTLVVLTFIFPILGRYTSINFPWSLTVDVILILTYLVLFFKNWKHLDFRLAHNFVVLLVSLWMLYILLQLANPEAPSRVAWFFGMRAIALYPFLIIPLGFIIFNSKKDWYNLLNIWLAFTALGIVWAIKQDLFGVSQAEQAWLDAGSGETHVLFGKLRVFSYYYDAGSFGAAMGHSCIVALILFLGPFSKRRKAIYLLMGLLSFYALMLSGTRGALAVPAIGGFAYLVMIRNIKWILIGLTILAFGFSFLKFTYIGQGNYDINRLRSALNPEDASLHVRIVNRARLTEYLQGKPFGGGVGSVGTVGQEFSPNTWLAQFPPDGLYTKIRAETGLIGRLLYVGIWLVILFKGIRMVWKLQDDEHKIIATAILSGFAGLLAANYGNEVMTQFPINIITYLSLAIVFSIRNWNKDGKVELENEPTPVMGKISFRTS